jgi:hypothetical protein
MEKKRKLDLSERAGINMTEGCYIYGRDQNNIIKNKDLKVGELYFDAIRGLCVVTELFAPREERYSNLIGKYEKIRTGRLINLYDNSNISFRVASDDDIVNFIAESLTSFNLYEPDVGNFLSIKLDHDGIYLTNNDESVFLDRKQTLYLRTILSREIT